jgi:hypothetical protein
MNRKVLVCLMIGCVAVAGVQAAWVQGVTATTNSSLAPGNDASQMVNEGHLVGTQTWANNYATGIWLSGMFYENQLNPAKGAYLGAGAQPYVSFAFATPTVLDKMWIWNGAQILEPGRALKKVDITYSTNGGASYNTLVAGITLNQVPGLAGMASPTLFDQTDILDMSAIGTAVTNVRINTYRFISGTSATTQNANSGNWQTNAAYPDLWTTQIYYGLSQVQFTAVPEPASLVLLGIGSLSLLRRKR